MLAENPAWQAVVPMDSKTKTIILDKISASFQRFKPTIPTDHEFASVRKINDPLHCNLICAICAGANPNYWHKENPATGLSAAAISGRFGLFRLLLEKRADHSDASNICQTVDYQKVWRKRFPDEYKGDYDDYFGELEKYGQKCTEFRSQLRDAR